MSPAAAISIPAPDPGIAADLSRGFVKSFRRDSFTFAAPPAKIVVPCMAGE
jgi:hypothetical protein